MKYKEEIQATTSINEFLRFYTNPSKIMQIAARLGPATLEDL